MIQISNETYIKISIGYVVVFLYVIILSVLIWSADLNHESPELALAIYSVGGFINLFLSIIITRYGSMNDKDISWHIVKYAMAHIFSLISLVIALIYLFF